MVHTATPGITHEAWRVGGGEAPAVEVQRQESHVMARVRRGASHSGTRPGTRVEVRDVEIAPPGLEQLARDRFREQPGENAQIGRASCRERV